MASGGTGQGLSLHDLTFPPQITAHVLKQVVLPAAQEIESLGSPHSSRIVQPLREASGEGPQDARVERSAQLSCSVKEEPDADVHDAGEGGAILDFGLLVGVWVSPAGMGTQGGRRKGWLAA